MILYDQWYYRHGIRRYDMLTNPTLTPTTAFTLPFHSIFHYQPQSDLEIGPQYDLQWFASVDGQRYVQHVLEMPTHEGNPIWTKLQPNAFVMRFRKTQREFRKVTDQLKVGIPRNALFIYNYAILPHLWRYRDFWLTPYHKWFNLRTTLWSNVAEAVAAWPDKHHFVVIDIHSGIPPLPKFKQAAEGHTRETLKVFHSPDLLDLLELFKWAGAQRADTAMGKLNAQQARQVTLVFNVSGYVAVMNLGLLNQWIKGQGTGTDHDIEKGKDSLLFQKQLLAMFNVLQAAQGTSGDMTLNAINPATQQPVEAVTEDAPEQVTQALSDLPVVHADIDILGDFGVKVPVPPTLDFDYSAVTPAPTATPTTDPIPVTLPDIERAPAIVKRFWDLDRPPENLNDLINPRVSETTRDYGDVLGQYDLGVLNQASEYHEQGLITNGQFNRFETLAGKYRELEYAPGRTVADVCVIPDAVLKDVVPSHIPDNPTVIDKSMLKSTLTVFDRNYITKVFDSDVANMVVAPQRAGFALTSFNKTRSETCMDKRDDYMVTYTPVDGERTTLRFSLPVVDPDGRYKINGVEYYLKKQRIDVPIRKVSPSKVALTSYYGKTFVHRSERVVNDFGGWVLRAIRNELKREKPLITAVRFGLGCTPTEDVPRAVSIIGSQYLSFTSGGIDYHFTVRDRDWCPLPEAYGDTQQQFPIGLDGRKVVMVDRLGYCRHYGKDEVLGTFTDLIGLPSEKAPLDVVELAIYGKRIPLVLALVYKYGIDEILSRLDANPVVVPAGERRKLAPNEYRIRFRDCSLVLDKDNRLATSILAGFNDVANAVANYDYADFNGTDVVVNVLESKSLSGRYLNEVDNQYVMFLDHITRGLLAEMGEPTEYGPLLIRAADLLLTDWSPAETDMAYMRLAGYERLAGAVYRELTRVMRLQRGKLRGRRGKLELHPNAVIRRIQDDGSSQLVEDSTPSHNLKEQEAVTTGGDGGRSARSMVIRTRAYHRNDMGTISEATVDSAAVAINTSTVYNPLFTSLRGTTGRYTPEDGVGSLMSTTALLSPGGDKDDS